MVFQKPVVSALVMASAQEEPEAEEAELVDPQTELKEKCGEESKCVSLNERLQECSAKLSAGKFNNFKLNYNHKFDHPAHLNLFFNMAIYS